MKKKLCLLSLLLLIPIFGFSVDFDTDVFLYNQLSFSYNSGFFPGVIQYAERIENDFPDSPFKCEAILKKGECLVRLGMHDEAETVLLNSIQINASDSKMFSSSCYWLAKSYELSGDTKKALDAYRECMKAREEFFSISVINSADIFFNANDFNSSVPLYEFVLENGNLFTAEQYAECVLRLCKACNKSGKAQETVTLYSKFSEDDFSALGLKKPVYLVLTELTGEAYEKIGNYGKAYELYCSVLESGEKSLAADALKKAYIVSSLHRKYVSEEPGTVLSNAQKYLGENPDLLGEFWTRLGTDAFSQGEFKKSVTYFDEAEKNVPVDLFLYALLYRAQIAAGKNPDEENARTAEKMILESRGILNKENETIWDRESFILLARYAAVQKDWEKVKRYAKNVVPLDEDTRFFLALAYYCTDDYQSANFLLKNQNTELHALSLARSGDLNGADMVYRKIKEARTLTDEERLNRSKILLRLERHEEALMEVDGLKTPEAKYVLGLGLFGSRSWKSAEENFSSFIKNPGDTDKNYLSYADFYLGYSKFRQGKNEEAYRTLSSFAEKNPSHELYYDAQIAAAECAFQNSKYDLAAEHAFSALNVSFSDERKEKSVLLYAEILSELNRYAEAEKLLEKHSERKDDFGMKSLFHLARLYEKQNLFEKADSAYKAVYVRFPEKKLSEQAMYRRGEVFYNAKIYEKAVKRFDEYTKTFSMGSFIDASRYFSAESLSENGNPDRAILQYRQLIQKYPKSSYVYSSAKNLIFIYRAKRDYSKAMEYASFLLENYAEKSKGDGIEKLFSELKSLSSGKSEKIVQKENEYENAGEQNSVSGRKIGTELAALYYENPDFQKDALSLAETLLELQENDIQNEHSDAAKNAELLGNAARKSENDSESARFYLKAAEYYRMGDSSDKASASFYGAYEAFKAAGLRKDANETAKLLKTLYPESRQAKRVKIIAD